MRYILSLQPLPGLLFFGFFIATQLTLAQNRELDSLYTVLENHPKEDSNRVRVLLKICWHEYTAHPEKGKTYAEEALQISKQINFLSGEGGATRQIGIYYMSKGNYDLAIKFVYSALQIFEKVTDVKGIGNSYNTIGSIYRGMRNIEKSKEFYNKAIEMYQRINDQKSIANIYNSLGVLSINFKKWKEARSYFQKSLEVRERIKDKFGISQC